MLRLPDRAPGHPVRRSLLQTIPPDNCSVVPYRTGEQVSMFTQLDLWELSREDAGETSGDFVQAAKTITHTATT